MWIPTPMSSQSVASIHPNPAILQLTVGAATSSLDLGKTRWLQHHQLMVQLVPPCLVFLQTHSTNSIHFPEASMHACTESSFDAPQCTEPWLWHHLLFLIIIASFCSLLRLYTSLATTGVCPAWRSNPLWAIQTNLQLLCPVVPPSLNQLLPVWSVPGYILPMNADPGDEGSAKTESPATLICLHEQSLDNIDSEILDQLLGELITPDEQLRTTLPARDSADPCNQPTSSVPAPAAKQQI